MRKKLVRLGAKGKESYAVILPKQWVKDTKANETQSIAMQVGENIRVKPIAPLRKRLIKLGKEPTMSYAVILPKRWIRDKKADKTMYVDMEISDTIVLKPVEQ